VIHRRLAQATFAVAMTVGLAVGACTSAASPNPPSASPSAAAHVTSATPSATTAAAASPAVAASPAGATAKPTRRPSTSTLAWGKIWDALPASFPTPVDAEPTQTGDGGASSATLAVPLSPSAASDWYSGALPDAGYSVEGATGPLENGGYILDAVGSNPDCRAQVTLTRAGAGTTATILFGAACPFD
jgi:hypothetical protein